MTPLQKAQYDRYVAIQNILWECRFAPAAIRHQKLDLVDRQFYAHTKGMER